MTTVTLNSSIDNSIKNDVPTTNYGTNVNYLLGESNADSATRRTLIKFDLSSLPSSVVISSAKLRLYADRDYSSNNRTFRVYRLKRSWGETTSSWNKYDGTNSWSTAGAFGSDDCEQTDIGSREFTSSETLNEYKEWSLDTAKIKEMIDGTFTNNGFLIKADTESNDAYRFVSNNNTNADQWPELIIDYTLAPTAGRKFQVVLIG